jgi:hypothetical protein
MGHKAKLHLLTQLTNSSINAWKGNGKQNGWPVADVTNSDTLNNIFDQGLAAPGVINFPICSFAEAFSNAYNKKIGPNYPCN